MNPMNPRLSLAVAAICTLLASCSWTPHPDAHYRHAPTTATRAADFEKSWIAAQGAATDAGVLIGRSDRTTRRITGFKGTAYVSIEFIPQQDQSLQVSFRAPDATENNPSLGVRWLAAYDRRMAR